eukprot:5215977-Pleurochrysis_carterae.AAC.1
MVEAKKALCIEDLDRFLSTFAGELSLQELQKGVGAEYYIELLGRASESEKTSQYGKPAMLRLPASSDGGDELVVSETGNGVESAEWRQRAGATA